LGGLYVSKTYRNKGIGKLLIEEVQSITTNLGYNVLYLRTENASDYYRKLGWQFVEKLTDEFNLETSVFLKKL
jgi:ribosomal protein S18 acetylase RimI-like enzyme